MRNVRIGVRWLLILPFSTGCGLVIYLLFGVSLWLGIALAVTIGLLSITLVSRSLTPEQRVLVKQRVSAGLTAGALATMIYDLTRYALAEAYRSRFWPFDVFPIFGQLLLGTSAPVWTRTVVGWLFHCLNGVGFGVAYLLMFRRPGVWTGLLWAASLEVLMLSLYPSWLNLQALNEFYAISSLGHAAYGCTLGLVGRHILMFNVKAPDRVTRG